MAGEHAHGHPEQQSRTETQECCTAPGTGGQNCQEGRGWGAKGKEKKGWNRNDSGHSTLRYRSREDSVVGAVLVPTPLAPKSWHCGCAGIQAPAGSKVQEEQREPEELGAGKC